MSHSEPPLNEEDVPPGEWLCPRCKALHDIKQMPAGIRKSTLNKSSTNHSGSDKDKLTTRKLNKDNGRHESSDLTVIYENKHQQFDHPCKDSQKILLLTNLVARKNPFADLVRISLLLNPREFELPEDYVPDIHFPGSSKKLSSSTSTREGRYTSYSVKRAQELDRNNLPLILRTCYVCRKGCRKAPLIHCDYCPLVYHADCVDPPLTVLPNTRWMCPNHVEPVAEEKLLTSSSFCERVRLWNHFSKPIDHERIKISFLDKIHQSPGPNRDEMGLVSKLGCRVPSLIKKEYAKHIREIDKYYWESEGSDQDATDCSEHTMRYSAHHAVVTDNPSTSISEKTSLERLQQEHETLMDIALRYMIESSKLLESKEPMQPKNGDKNL